MVRHVLGALKRAAIGEISRYARAAKVVIANGGFDSGGSGAPVDQFPGARLRQRPITERFGAPVLYRSKDELTQGDSHR